MDNSEFFQNFKFLIRIMRLDLEIEKHLKIVSEEKNRVNLLHIQKDLRLKNLQEDEIKLIDVKTKMDLSEKKLNELNKQKEQVKRNAIKVSNEIMLKANENEYELLTIKIKELEEKLFDFLQVEDELNIKIQEAKNYFKGIDKTIHSITLESESVIAFESEKMELLNSEINHLLEKCLKEFKNQFLNLNKKFRFHSPIVPIVKNTCFGCKFKIPTEAIYNVDRGVLIYNCSSCGRLLLPSALTDDTAN